MQVSRGSLLVAGLLLLWAGLFGWSFVDFSTTEATGDGFTRGSNRIVAFLQWQFVAGIVAVPVYMVGRNEVGGTALRWASRAPLALATALLAAIVGLLLWVKATG